MPHKIFTPEQIIRKLRVAEVLIVEGMTTHNAARQIVRRQNIMDTFS